MYKFILHCVGAHEMEESTKKLPDNLKKSRLVP